MQCNWKISVTTENYLLDSLILHYAHIKTRFSLQEFLYEEAFLKGIKGH